ncbi:hypothetical protein J8I87_00250 [Paraburkholderia sp. LEh10]|uniref:hypothetical protein n=1 Tax=Paraburkholderia sp. LEh10 TaxID=2821353 RepID=UPI001AE56910|nr:hypothetical protein [Paraburkholderia sp. LEh10]MBP0588182.1 hypothetical protein [Paraburkholderia sp. LEh10]
MKTIYAALASALLVSTAFAQTAAPTPTDPTTAVQAGQANMKASAEVQTDASKIDGAAKEAGSVTNKATTSATDKESAEVHANKKPAVHVKKTQSHKLSKKEPGIEAAPQKAKTDAGNEVSTARVKADTKTDAVTRTQ